jgi:hypothetical protein
MSANLTNYLDPKMEDLKLPELICGPPTLAKNMKGSMQIDGDDNHTKKGNKDLCGLEMLNRLF